MAKDKKSKGGFTSKKTTVTKKQLSTLPDTVNLGEVLKAAIAPKREFSSGNTGYFFGEKVQVAGLKCQVSCSVTVIGSKDAE